MRIAIALVLGALLSSPVQAQEIIDLTHPPGGNGQQPEIISPPSVDNGIADGIAKTAGSPSVGDGRANGVVKQPGSPSVGNGIANGVVKSTTINQ